MLDGWVSDKWWDGDSLAGQYLRMYKERGSSKSSSHSPGSWVCTRRMTLEDNRDSPAMVAPQNWKRQHGGGSGSGLATPTWPAPGELEGSGLCPP